METCPAKPLQRAGIVGAGQLALMLAEGAARLGLAVSVLARNPTEPAARISGATVVFGDPEDDSVLEHFLRSVDCVAFEQELRDARPFETAARRIGTLPKHAPSVEAMVLCSDKLAQKERLRASGLPTAPWRTWRPREESAAAWLGHAGDVWPSGFVLKWARGGYDGKGNHFVSARLAERGMAEAVAFCERAASDAVYAEPRLAFEAELAVVSTRWRDGRLTQYPPVVTRQEAGICVEVRGPAVAFGIAPQVAAEARRLAAAVGEAFDLTGTYAVELFLLPGGELLVNEIAPRVHNSGHYTQDAADSSQFESHWRAILALPPGESGVAPFFGMLNVIGGPKTDEAPPFAATGEGTFSHWYGKSSRPGRKLGHVNVVATSRTELEARMARIAAAIHDWRTQTNTGETA